MTDEGRRVRDLKGRYHGIGTIVKSYRFGDMTQYLVDFGDEEGVQKVLGSDLEFLRSLTEKLFADEMSLRDHSLRLRAGMMVNDNLRTGSLSRVKMELLPHQIMMVDKVASTPAKGFMIADDVGLGKTIEAGMVIQSFIAHGRADRILILCPASLCIQWREQLDERFGEWFDIYNYDFHVHDPKRWDRCPRVIASIQAMRLEEHRDVLLGGSSVWDLVIVDEAHHLSAREYGEKLDKTMNFQLLERLRDRTGFMLFLTATPHQGEDDRFVHLLRLLDDSYVRSLDDLSRLGVRINHIIGRNVKSKVTDFEGNKLFKDHTTVEHRIKPSDDYRAFLKDLESYVEDGMDILGASNTISSMNFVLTAMLKIAASSPAAICRTLKSRLDGLGRRMSAKHGDIDDDMGGEQEENLAAQGGALFDGEAQRLRELIAKVEDIKDDKLIELDTVLDTEELSMNREERLLIFTEYRGTQNKIVEHLEGRFGKGSVLVMNGSQDMNEKRKVVREFETSKRFLVSTEAGGEGIDLQKRCHIMVNYDIPWNPMRLHQRVGRLDRFGQREKVIAHYLMMEGTIDERIQEYLEQKIDLIQKRLNDLDGGDPGDMRGMILGQMSISRRRLTEEFLGRPGPMVDDRAENEKVVSALGRMMQMFGSVKGFDLNEMKRLEAKYSMNDLECFMDDYLISRHRRLMKDGDTVHFEVPDEIREMKVFRGRPLIKTRVHGTFDRTVANEKGEPLLGLGNEYIDAAVDRALRSEGPGEAVTLIARGLPADIPNRFLMTSFIVTSRPPKGGKESMEGVEFFIYDPAQDTIMLGAEANKVAELLGSTRGITLLDRSQVPDQGELDVMMDNVLRAVESIPRQGRVGSAVLNSIAWVQKGDD